MPPFERLRHLARWTDANDDALASEAAELLGAFADDPAGLVVACRQLLAHHPTSGPLWWLTASLLGSADPRVVARESGRILAEDPTAARLAERLPFPADHPIAVLGWPAACAMALDERPDLDTIVLRLPFGSGSDLSRRLRSSAAAVRVLPVHEAMAASPSHLLVEVRALGRDRAVVDAGTGSIVEALGEDGTKLWLVAAAGRVLPERLLDALLAAAPVADFDDDDRPPEVIPLSGALRFATRRGLVELVDLPSLVDCPVAPELLKPLR